MYECRVTLIIATMLHPAMIDAYIFYPSGRGVCVQHAANIHSSMVSALQYMQAANSAEIYCTLLYRFRLSVFVHVYGHRDQGTLSGHRALFPMMRYTGYSDRSHMYLHTLRKIYLIYISSLGTRPCALRWYIQRKLKLHGHTTTVSVKMPGKGRTHKLKHPSFLKPLKLNATETMTTSNFFI